MEPNYELEIKLKRDEILQTIGRHEYSLRFLITTSVTVIAFGLTTKIELIPLAHVLILLLGRRVYLWHDELAQHAAYCIVFLENETSKYYWETINQASVTLAAKEKKEKGIDVITDKEIPFLIAITQLTFLWCYFYSLNALSVWDTFLMITSTIFSIGLFIGFFFFTASVHTRRKAWEKIFREIKTDREKQ
jgi:hypothetical protein